MPAPRDSASSRGSDAELFAAQWLQQKGLTLVERNYSAPCGEIDLVMREAQTWVFVEVRYRRYSRYGGAVGSLNRAKLDRVAATALHYLQHHHCATSSARIDALLLDGPSPNATTTQVNWIKHIADSRF